MSVINIFKQSGFSCHSFCGVLSHVFLQLLRLFAGVITLLAGKRFVGLQILGASVRVAALLACKGLFSSVCEHVAPQITSLSTTIVTLVTSERLLS